MRHLLEEAFNRTFGSLEEAKKSDIGSKIDSLISHHELRARDGSETDKDFSSRSLVHLRAAKIAHEEGRHKAAAQHLRDAESLKSNGVPGNLAHKQDKLDKKLSRDFGVKDTADPNSVANAYKHFDK